MINPEDFAKHELLNLLIDAAKNWLAHDGAWFLAAEENFDIETAIELDKKAWERFTVIEARRIMSRLGIEPGGGIPALIKTLDYRLYAYLNKQETSEITEDRCVFKMKECRVQSARRRKGLPDFPCKTVGIVEYTGFAKTIDSRIKTKCISCPPDAPNDDFMCAWEFWI